MDFLTAIQNIATSPFTLSLIPILISSLLTYYFTKRNIKNDRKYEISNKSFELVYLPLIRRFRKIPSYNLSINEAKILYLQIQTLYEKHIIYCNPIVNRLLEELKVKIDKGKRTNDVICRLHSHSIDTYYRLRRRLNYPTISIIDSINYRPLNNSMIFIIAILFLVILMLLTFLGLLLQYNSNLFLNKILTYIILICLLCFFVLLFAYIVYYITDKIISFIHKNRKSK